MKTKSEKYIYNLEVRGYELDAYNHVNNAVYLNYAEQARWDLFKQLGLLDEIKGSGKKVVIVDIHIKYVRQLMLFDEVIVETQMETSKPFLIFHQFMKNKKTDKIVARAEVKSLFLDHLNKPCDIPDEMNKFFTE